MAEKTFNIDFIVDKPPTNLRPNTAFTSIVNKNNKVFVTYVDLSTSRLKAGVWDGTTYYSYFVDPVADWTITNDGHYLPSIGIDRNGYLHLTAHMAQYPRYIDPAMPARYQSGANCMYFKSDSPYDPSSWTFYGDQSAYTIPGEGFNNIKFHNDNNGILYVFHRCEVDTLYTMGIKGIGLSVYDETSQTWTQRGAIPTARATATNKCIFWHNGGDSDSGASAYQGYYNQLFFDSQNRMHFATEVFNGSESGASTCVYTMSDDGGVTWKKADGTSLVLPVNIASGTSKGDIIYQQSGTALENQSSWIVFDDNDYPYVTYLVVGSAPVFRKWDGTSWSSPVAHVANYSPNSKIYNYKTKKVLVNNFSFGTQVRITDMLTDVDDFFQLTYQITSIDRKYLYDGLVFYGVSINGASLEYGSFYIDLPYLQSNAGASQSINVATVTLDGTQSRSSTFITSYLWQQLSGPNTANILTPSGGSSIVNGLIVGDYVFRLTVTDNNSLTDTDEVTITVNPVISTNKANARVLL